MRHTFMKRFLDSTILGLIGVLVVVGSVVSYRTFNDNGYDELVSFFPKSNCNGTEYRMILETNRCISLPRWLSQEDNLSVRPPEGRCIMVYNVDSCKPSILRGTKKGRTISGCNDARQLGFRTIRSFRWIPC